MIRFIPNAEIESAAQQFLNQHHPSQTLPIPIEEIIEFQLGINIVPIPELFREHNIDAFLSLNLEDLNIDQEHLERRINRARFSLAHEVGHLVLHREYLKNLKIDSIEKWKEEVLGKGTGHAMMETQANMFAGYLLMPTAPLVRAFNQFKEELKNNPDFGSYLPDDKILAPYAARQIAKVFEVSEQSAAYRLSRLN